jgi:hypothetical protein
MVTEAEISNLIGQPESQQLEYKAVLPPSRTIAQLICAFANSIGGYIILGVSEAQGLAMDVPGLSQDFHANSITHKALDLILPTPTVSYQYVQFQGKSLYAIKVEKSDAVVSLEGRIFKRVGVETILANPPKLEFKGKYQRIKTANKLLVTNKQQATNSKSRLIDHYQSILKIIDDLSKQLYPSGPTNFTNDPEGKVLTRILYSSFVDNFETYLSDILYEIFLANPSTLKSQSTVTLEEVLNCSDLQEFVKYYAKQRLGKLQKGSVKGFIKENSQLRDLGIIDDTMQNEIEKILQIRHLYAHRNGIIDEKFLQYFPGGFSMNTEHQMAIDEILDKMEFLGDVTTQIDAAAIKKYKLAKSQ